jgi:cytochrome b pre-mRNA-processing protein 3
MIARLFRKDPRKRSAEALYERIVAAARAPGLYLALGVPDTIEGRFEAVALHVILVLRRLRRLPGPAGDIAQELVDAFFRHMDASLRESGVGDMRVPKRMKELAGGFYGRAQAYDGPLDAKDAVALARALGVHVHGDEAQGGALARYALAADEELARHSLDGLLVAGPSFAAPVESQP